MDIKIFDQNDEFETANIDEPWIIVAKKWLICEEVNWILDNHLKSLQFSNFILNPLGRRWIITIDWLMEFNRIELLREISHLEWNGLSFGYLNCIIKRFNQANVKEYLEENNLENKLWWYFIKWAKIDTINGIKRFEAPRIPENKMK